MMRTYRFRAYPTNMQIHVFESTLDSCRDLYNAMLDQRIYALRSRKHVNYNSQQNELPELKKAFPEFKNIHSLAIQDVALRIDKTFDNFFRRVKEKKNGKNIKAGFPRFKSRDRYNSITHTVRIQDT
ncbi:MAG: RNA-guided endonuclease InsQ/TnpB family protein [Thermoplasmataceae archaeon]